MTSWKNSSGRVEGGDGYQFGDLTYSLLNSLYFQNDKDVEVTSDQIPINNKQENEVNDVSDNEKDNVEIAELSAKNQNWWEHITQNLPKPPGVPNSWKDTAGREEGSEGYQFGDLTRSLYGSIFSKSGTSENHKANKYIHKSFQLSNEQLVVLGNQWFENLWELLDFSIIDNCDGTSDIENETVQGYVNINWCCVVLYGKEKEVDNVMDKIKEKFIDKLVYKEIIISKRLSELIIGNTQNAASKYPVIHPGLKAIITVSTVANNTNGSSEVSLRLFGFEKNVHNCIRLIDRWTTELKENLESWDVFYTERDAYIETANALKEKGHEVISQRGSQLTEKQEKIEQELCEQNHILLRTKATLLRKMQYLQSFDYTCLGKNEILKEVHEKFKIPVNWNSKIATFSYSPFYQNLPVENGKGALKGLLCESLSSCRIDGKLCKHLASQCGELCHIQQIENWRLWYEYEQGREQQCSQDDGDNNNNNNAWFEPNFDLHYAMQLEGQEELKFVHVSNVLVSTLATFGQHSTQNRKTTCSYLSQGKNESNCLFNSHFSDVNSSESLIMVCRGNSECWYPAFLLTFM